jgi:hypothetical protein
MDLNVYGLKLLEKLKKKLKTECKDEPTTMTTTMTEYVTVTSLAPSQANETPTEASV